MCKCFKPVRIAIAVLFLVLFYFTCAADLVPTALGRNRAKTPPGKQHGNREQNISKIQDLLPRVRGEHFSPLLRKVPSGFHWQSLVREHATALTVAAAITQRQRQPVNTIGIEKCSSLEHMK